MPISLTEALKDDRLEEFIQEQEAAGVGKTTKGAFDEAVKRVATPRRVSGRTSRSALRDGLTGR